MNYDAEIVSLRKIREKFVNDFRKTNNEGQGSFEYFNIDQKWLIPVEISLRSIKDGPKDYQTIFQKVGVADIKVGEVSKKLGLYKRTNHKITNFEYYLFNKDKTTRKTSYPTGRFIPVIQKNEDNTKFFADFNLAYSPMCAHTDQTIFCPTATEDLEIPVEAGEKYIIH